MSDDTAASQEAFTPITTQDELDRVIGQRIARERAKFADYDEIRAQLASAVRDKDTAERELGDLQKAYAELETRLATAERSELRLRVAAEKGVPADLLNGDTEDALVAAADALLAFQRSAGASSNHGPISGLDGLGQFASRNDEAREVFGL